MGLIGKPSHPVVEAPQLKQMLDRRDAMVVDVREPNEFAAGHIPDAINLPLSKFNADQLPDPGGRKLVLTCAGGRRSGVALDRCVAAKTEVDTHLRGGFAAWRNAGLPVEK
ncbi:MAG: rhodanese-like domain-containing protein [Sphingomicrobium sp.]